MSKWGKHYFGAWQRQLFQSGAMFVSNWGSLLQGGAKFYFKVRKLFQSETIISKWGITIAPVVVIKHRATKMPSKYFDGEL